MASKSRVVFNSKKFGKMLLDNIVKEQTRRLIEYAEKELNTMVATREFHDRTGQAANSYVWAVYYNGKKKGYGFYGKAGGGKSSYLHEWSPSIREAVYGRKAARAFLNEYTPNANGWEIVWCAAAPYLGYHEGAGYAIGNMYYHFNVMSQEYDQIKQTLEPKCRVTFRINPPQY